MAVLTDKFLKIVKKLLEKPESEDFKAPVDYKRLGLVNYLDVVKTPMDLGTVKQKLERKAYKSNLDVKQDLDLIWNNCKNFNQTGSEIHQLAENLQKKCESYIQKESELLNALAAERERNYSTLSKRKVNPSYEDPVYNQAPPPQPPFVQDAGTLSIKVLLFKKLRELESSKLREIVQEMIQRYPKCIKEIDSEGLKLRLDDLTADQLREIVSIVDGSIVDQNKDAKASQSGKVHVVAGPGGLKAEAVPKDSRGSDVAQAIEV